MKMIYFTVALALSTGLIQNYANVSVNEVECPDLTKAPFHLAASGLCGTETIINVASPQNVDRTRIYDLANIGQKLIPNSESVFMCGAGAGPHPLTNSHCEVLLSNESINRNYF